MNHAVHNKLVSFIWSIADDCLRDVYVRGKYRDVILPMVVLRRLDALLEPNKTKVMEELAFQQGEMGLTELDESALQAASGYVFYNISKWTLSQLHKTATNNQQILLANFEEYLDGFSSNVKDIIRRFNVKAGGPHAAAKSLSGGNLQKFIVGREIDANPKLLIVSQPTWGVDVGAAAQIRGSILALRDAGCAVLVVSEELDELFEICDRLHVVAKGHLSPSVPRAEATVERIGEWMSGLWHADVQAHLAQQAQQQTAAGEVQHA